MRIVSAMFAAAFVLVTTAAAAPHRSVAEISAELAHADGATDDMLIARDLDALRAMRSKAAPAAETLSAMLPHRAAVNQDRDKYSLIRLRAYIYVTLSDIGVPPSALPSLLDTLANADDRMMPLELAAAARAAGSLGPRGQRFVPYLRELLSLRPMPELISLERYDQEFPASEATTLQQEVVRALRQIEGESR